MNRLNVQSIFTSIDGEANGFGGAGELSTFIRLKGCNLLCRWCDTKYAQKPEPANWMTIEEVLGQLLKECDKVTVTGGEPLLQFPSLLCLLKELVQRRCRITVETNGSKELTGIYANFDSGQRFSFLHFVVDFKLPSSRMLEAMDPVVFRSLDPWDVIKFVIADKDDYDFAREVIFENPQWEAKKVFSPVTAKLKWLGAPRAKFDVPFELDTSWPRQLAEMMIKDGLYDVQFSLQLHKVLWPGAKDER